MRRSLMLLLALLSMRYLHWRFTASLNLSTPIAAALSLKRLLFGRAGAWPNRHAPPEWQAFFALISRLLLLPKQISSAGNSSYR